MWEVILSADEDSQITAVHLQGEPLDFEEQQCRIPSLTGHLTVSFQDGKEQDIPLFNDAPLIFKLRKDWTGDGRKTSGITTGHFIVIAPEGWERIGHVPVEPKNCADENFRAHYFYQEKTPPEDGALGFKEWPLYSSVGIELEGSRVFDDSDQGDLFVGDPPSLKLPLNIKWAQVGEEAGTGTGWGKSFKPDNGSLSSVMNGRTGYFFIRVYDSQSKLVDRDSTMFRYLPNLGKILVDGDEYTQDTVILPASTGYSHMEVRFVGADGSTLLPALPSRDSHATVRSGVIEVMPRPEADRISCSLESDASGVCIVLDLPRIWWRLGDSQTDSDEWRDKPLTMTRQEFRKYAHSDGTMWLLSRRFESVRAGFDNEPDELRQYSRKKTEDRISIPLEPFADYYQIYQRLNDDVYFAIEYAGRKLPLIRVSADPMPEIISFTAEPMKIFTGQGAILKWDTRNVEQARVAINPEIGIVEPHGTCVIRPTGTTRYRLTLSIPDANGVEETVVVTVYPTPDTDERVGAIIWCSRRQGWKRGKGFSATEIKAAGLTLREAIVRSLPIDKRRRSSHSANVDTIRRLLDD